RLWPDSFVEESNLTQNIYTLRKALGGADYIETVPRRGYRFAAEIREWEEGPAELLVKESTRSSIIIEEEEEAGEQTLVEAPPETGKLLQVGSAKQAGRRTGLAVLAAALTLAAALGVASYSWKRGEAGRAGAESAVRSIAVLPT